MIVLFIALLIFLAIIIIVTVIAEWAFSLCNNSVSLSFNSFRKFYDIASKKYELASDSILYNNEYCWQYINMKTPIDYARYWLWFKKKEHHKKTADKAERTQEYINCVRKDLEKFMGDV